MWEDKALYYIDIGTSPATQNMAEKCITLHQNAGSTRQLVRATQERLVELRLQVDALKRQCSGRDRPLCDTLDSTGLEVSMNLDRVSCCPSAYYIS